MSDKTNSFKVNADLQNRINGETDFETLRAMLHDEAAAQGVTMATNWEQNPERVNTATFSRDDDSQQRDSHGRFTSQSNGAQEFKKTEVIGGRELEFSAESPELLETLIAQAKQLATVLQSDQSQQQQVSAAEQARRDQAANDARIARNVDLELKFKRSEISTQQYLEQSGAIAEYMEAHGAPMAALAQTVQEVETARATQSWANAVEEYLHSAAGVGWQGGDRNREMVGLKLQQLGLTDAEDKVAAIAAAVKSLRESEMLFQPEAAVRAERELEALKEEMSNASTPEEIRQSFENYKAALAAQGLDANERFVKTFARSGEDAKYSPAYPSGERSSGVFNR